MNTSVHGVKLIYHLLVFQTRMGCADYLFAQGRNALHRKLWTRGDSNHCHCAARALGAVVLFLIGLFVLSVIFICKWHSLSANQMSHGCVCHSTTSELLSATLYSGLQDISVKWCLVHVLLSLVKAIKSRFKCKITSYFTIFFCILLFLFTKYFGG